MNQRNRSKINKVFSRSGRRHGPFVLKDNRQAVLMLLAGLMSIGAAGAQEHAIDTAKSSMTVRVYKSGLFSAFGHDHEISASIESGTVNSADHRVELHMNASWLRVRDP